MQGHATERTKLDDWTWLVTCVQCGQKFESSRSDASFCSTKHRVAFSKEPQKKLNAIQSLEDEGYRLVNMAVKYKNDDEVFEAMKKLQERIKYAMSCFEK